MPGRDTGGRADGGRARSRTGLGADTVSSRTGPDAGTVEPRTGLAGFDADGSPPRDRLEAVLLVSRARALARCGDPAGALRLLREADGTDLAEHRDVLDLRARVHAQRGEPTEAAACWRRLLGRHPEDPAATAGLARLGRRGPVAALGRHRTRTALVAAVCVVTAVLAGVVTTPDEPQPARADADRSARQETPESGVTAPAGQEQDRAAARRVAELTALARDLRAPGVRTTMREDSVEVVFTEGLFSEGAQLTATGAERLAALGERLTGRQAAVMIHGHAATVPGAPRRGGSVVALWRALIAARELSAASGKPLTAFTTNSADQRDAPYGSAARNRTVTVVISPP